MSRKKLSEYAAKRMIVDDYQGIYIKFEGSDMFVSKSFATLNDNDSYVIKVDQGEKKRFKRGLIGIDLPATEVKKKMEELLEKGFSQFIVEKYVKHDADNESYISFERVRDGIQCLYSEKGGVQIEEHPEEVKRFKIKDKKDIQKLQKETNIDSKLLDTIYKRFEEDFFGFLEINPLVKVEDEWILMDAALTVDDAGEYFVKEEIWSSNDFVKSSQLTPEEIEVQRLDSQTPASLKLTVLNPEGSLGLLFSSGGSSIVLADEIHALGLGKEIINYGEYSGGPTRDETYEYAKQVLSLLIKSSAKKKVLIIAGGVANFTDILQTFSGVIDALERYKDKLREQGIKVFVRRGGPNEKAGLAAMEKFLKENDLFGSVHGSETVITNVIHEALEIFNSK